MDTPIPPSRRFGRIAIAIVVGMLVVSAVVLYAISSMSAGSSGGTCELLPSSQMDYYASNGAPRFQYSNIRAAIQQGWETLCNSPEFVAAIQAHGEGSFISGGGFIDSTDYRNSIMVIAVTWSQSTNLNCMQYTEKWNIFIGNGTVTAPTTTSDMCISA